MASLIRTKSEFWWDLVTSAGRFLQECRSLPRAGRSPPVEREAIGDLRPGPSSADTSRRRAPIILRCQSRRPWQRRAGGACGRDPAPSPTVAAATRARAPRRRGGRRPGLRSVVGERPPRRDQPPERAGGQMRVPPDLVGHRVQQQAGPHRQRGGRRGRARPGQAATARSIGDRRRAASRAGHPPRTPRRVPDLPPAAHGGGRHAGVSSA